MQNSWKILIILGAFIFFISVLAAMAVVLVKDTNIPAISLNSVVVVPLKGEITESTASEVIGMIDEAVSDSSVKAIVLDIDSPGGAVLPGKEIMNKVREAKNNKPVVARIGQSGASAAYYVASASTLIIADEDSITGSLGVRMTIIQYYELFNKLGINVKSITSGEMKDIGSPYRNMTDEEEKRLQEIVNKIYYHFISGIAENRGMPVSELREIAKGDIYLGSEALENGLVDKLGNLDDAIHTAAELSGIKDEEPKVKYMYREPTFYDLFAEGSTNIGYGVGKAFLELSESKRQGNNINFN